MRYALNILSPGNTPEPVDIAEIARTAQPVDVIGTAAGRKVGTTVRYYMAGEDLYAEADLDEGAAVDSGPTSHAESVLAIDKDDGKAHLIAVIITRLPRGMLQSANLGLSFMEAVQVACESKLGHRRRAQEPS